MTNEGESHRQESYELLPGWPEGEPVPRYLPPPVATKGIFTQLLDNIQRRLGLKPASSSPSITDQRVIEIANVVRSKVARLYNTSFSTYTVASYTVTSQTTEYGDGTLYTIQICIAPAIQDHTVLQIKVLNSVTGEDFLVNHSLPHQL